jgi:hypothetical protein
MRRCVIFVLTSRNILCGEACSYVIQGDFGFVLYIIVLENILEKTIKVRRDNYLL